MAALALRAGLTEAPEAGKTLRPQSTCLQAPGINITPRAHVALGSIQAYSEALVLSQLCGCLAVRCLGSLCASLGQDPQVCEGTALCDFHHSQHKRTCMLPLKKQHVIAKPFCKEKVGNQDKSQASVYQSKGATMWQ